jgi:hypothetical protein
LVACSMVPAFICASVLSGGRRTPNAPSQLLQAAALSS